MKLILILMETEVLVYQEVSKTFKLNIETTRISLALELVMLRFVENPRSADAAAERCPIRSYLNYIRTTNMLQSLRLCHLYLSQASVPIGIRSVMYLMPAPLLLQCLSGPEVVVRLKTNRTFVMVLRVEW